MYILAIHTMSFQVNYDIKYLSLLFQKTTILYNRYSNTPVSTAGNHRKIIQSLNSKLNHKESSRAVCMYFT